MLKNTVSNRKMNLNQVSSQIVQLLATAKYLKNSFYLPYLKLTDYKKRKLKRDIETIVREYALTEEFYIALARDVIKPDNEHDFSEVYLYVRKKFFGGNSRSLLMKLYECIVGENNDRNKNT